MVEDTRALVRRIQALTREEAMEAAAALAEELDTGEEAQGDARRFLEAVEASPLQHIPVTEELARVLLLIAADDEEMRPTVERILDSIGTKAFILGGLEIVALAALAVAALHTVVSRGRTSSTCTAIYEFGPDGNVTRVVIAGEETFGLSADVGGIVTAAVGGAPAAG